MRSTRRTCQRFELNAHIEVVTSGRGDEDAGRACGMRGGDHRVTDKREAGHWCAAGGRGDAGDGGRLRRADKTKTVACGAPHAGRDETPRSQRGGVHWNGRPAALQKSSLASTGGRSRMARTFLPRLTSGRATMQTSLIAKHSPLPTSWSTTTMALPRARP